MSDETTYTDDFEKADAIALAVDHLDAKRHDSLGLSLYYAHETQLHYLATDEDMADLGVRLHRGVADAYSHWCADIVQDEIDVREVIEANEITDETDLEALAHDAGCAGDRVTQFACIYLVDKIVVVL